MSYLRANAEVSRIIGEELVKQGTTVDVSTGYRGNLANAALLKRIGSAFLAGADRMDERIRAATQEPKWPTNREAPDA